ncbi:MAG: hypothetical protein JXJ17_15130, partial [Anaerolineae bacterium]|nr:hypothetical protein [Anaerolineae bacterium]
PRAMLLSKTYSYYMTRVKIDGSKLHIPCEVIEKQIAQHLEEIVIPSSLLPSVRKLYQQHIAEINGPDRDEEIARLKRQISLLQAEEADLVRLFLQKQLSQKAYDELRREWQSKLKHKHKQIEQLQREAVVYIDDLETAIALLSSAPILFARLTRRKQAQLLKMIFAMVVVDAEGIVQDVQLNAPFAYLSSLKALAKRDENAGVSQDIFDELASSPGKLSFPERAYATELQA